MIRQYVWLFVVLTVGAVGGSIMAFHYRSANEVVGTPDAQSPAVSGKTSVPGQVLAGHEPAGAMSGRSEEARPATDRLVARLADLEQQVTLLRQQVDRLQQNQEAAADGLSEPPGNEAAAPSGTSLIDGLVAAGLDAFTAEDIARRQGEAQLMQLELRDRAIREGYIGTAQYREELQALRENEFDLKQEINDAAYDRYLYYTGRSNRVAIDSVILGSAAEQIGIEPGDLLYRYDNQRVYATRDLNRATTLGERDELVDIVVIRQGNEISLSIPRGPLGVRLSGISIEPADTGG